MLFSLIQVSRDGSTLVRVDQPDPSRHADLSIYHLPGLTARVSRVPIDSAVSSMAVSPDSRYVAVGGGDDGRVLVLDAQTGHMVRSIAGFAKPKESPYALLTAGVVFQPDGSLVISAENGTVRIFDSGSFRELRRIDVGASVANVLPQLAKNGRILIGWGQDGLGAIDLSTGALRWRAGVFFGGCPALRVIEPRGGDGTVLCGGAYGRTRTFALDTGRVGPTDFSLQQGSASDISVSPDGKTLSVVGAGGVVATWRLDETGLLTRVMASGLVPAPDGYNADGTALLAYHVTGQWPLPLSVKPSVWNAASGAEVDALPKISTPLTFVSNPNVLVAEHLPGGPGYYDVMTHRRLPGHPATRELPSGLFQVDRARHRLTLVYGDRTMQVLDLDTGADIGRSLVARSFKLPRVPDQFGLSADASNDCHAHAWGSRLLRHHQRKACCGTDRRRIAVRDGSQQP